MHSGEKLKTSKLNFLKSEVYKGMWKNTPVALKLLKNASEEALKQEVGVLTKLERMNSWKIDS